MIERCLCGESSCSGTHTFSVKLGKGMTIGQTIAALTAPVTTSNDVSDYIKYRGKCKEFCEKAIEQDSTLKLVRGHYHCPVWGEQAHWWTVRADGSIFDPTKDQFPSKGIGEYVEFDGRLSCEECGAETTEDTGVIMGNYICCSGRCARRLVGV